MWNDVSGEGYFEQPNEVQAPGAKKKNQNVAPIFIRTIMENKGEELNIFGHTISVVRILGILKDYDVQSTKATCEVEDHTGRVTCLHWNDSDSEESPNFPAVKIGSYVMVVGKLRNQDGNTQIMVLQMEPVDDPNVVTTFKLEVINARYEFEAAGKSTAYIRQNNPGADLVNSMSFVNNDNNGYGMSTLQEKVLEIVRSSTGPEGAYRNDILKQFPPAQHSEVNAALLYLTEEGLAYTTTSHDLFKVTDSM